MRPRWLTDSISKDTHMYIIPVFVAYNMITWRFNPLFYNQTKRLKNANIMRTGKDYGSQAHDVGVDHQRWSLTKNPGEKNYEVY